MKHKRTWNLVCLALSIAALGCLLMSMFRERIGFFLPAGLFLSALANLLFCLQRRKE